MRLPISWLKEYVDIDLPLDELAYTLTMAGLEVEEVQLVGLPAPAGMDGSGFKFSGISWNPEKIVVAQIDEVMPHPNADRLVLCRLQDGLQEHIVLTGAPNLFPYKGQGPLPKPLKVAYAKEGAQIYDGHQNGLVLTTLKRAKIRGVDSYSMVCSEKELGISDEHEGVIILDHDAPTGMSLVDYMGDAVLEIKILPNVIRAACVVGVARELAAMTGKELRKPQHKLPMNGPKIEGQVSIQITDSALNPRFVVGLLRGATAQPSPYWVQRRLRLAGMRPINSIVDATNYVMLELDEPLHAFDYDLLVKRAKGKAPTIITRPAEPGEKLTTLDGVERLLDPFTIVVADTAGSLSLAGVMGGQESEVTPETTNILLEGASWNFINIRRTSSAQKLSSEAGYRFARDIHPALAEHGVLLGLQRMADWSGGQIAEGLVDAYSQPFVDPVLTLNAPDVERQLGISISAEEIAQLLRRLEFRCTVIGNTLQAQSPPHRTDIGQGRTGQADLLEEISRIYGYNNIPPTALADSLPEAHRNDALEGEEKLRNILVKMGLQEVITVRMTAPERESRLLPLHMPAEDVPYVRLANPIASDRVVMRRSLLAAVLEILERNSRLRERLAFFEIGPVFLPQSGEALPVEQWRLAITLAGKRHLPSWDRPETNDMDFFDLKGILETAMEEMFISGVTYEAAEHPSFHPGKCARVCINGGPAGIFGELHPQVKERYDFSASPVLAAEINLGSILSAVPARYEILSVPTFPPVLEDIAVIVDESVQAGRVEEVIRQSGGKLLTGLRLFDIYRGEQVGVGLKSMAYSLIYRNPDRTLTDVEAAQVRQRIIRALEKDLNGKVRSG